jgi:hypothetical protein
VSDSPLILVWEASTIVIPGPKPLEQCRMDFGDIHVEAFADRVQRGI